MPNLMTGKTALILGVANKWSLAYAIAQAFAREGARLVLTYQGERQKDTVRELAAELSSDVLVLSCDVLVPQEIANLINTLKMEHVRLDTAVHSIAFANREDLSRPFVETSRDGYLLAQEVSSYSLVAVARATAEIMTHGGSITALTYSGSARVIPNYNVKAWAQVARQARV